MTLKPKVALSSEFMLRLAKLPEAVHNKVSKWAIQFQADPRSPGINYEVIHNARDPNLRSVRIDRDWRGIVFKPDAGDVYVLLHVDHHDDAYRWGQNRRLSINPISGAIQLLVLESIVEQVAAPAQVSVEPASPPMPALFARIADQQLMSLGVPEEMLPAVRSIVDDAQLDALQPLLPIEAYEGLFLVAAGESTEKVLADREAAIPSAVDLTDFGAALAMPESQSRFLVVSDDDDLASMLNAPLAQWRIFLHPTQQRLAVGDRSGPVRVLGGAGTGKTVLAMHRTRWLAEHRTASKQKVLFTTFTRNLAADIEQNLRSMCSPETMARIDVLNLDAWVAQFMRSRKFGHRIVYDRRHDAAQQAWQAALAMKDPALELPDSFYEQELDQVVLAQGVTTRDVYRTARRNGRRVVLNRERRDKVWPVFEEYRGQLASRRLKEVDDAYREAADLLRAESTSGSGLAAYSAIVVDETQDFGSQALRLLRAMIPPGANDLFFVGDGHQRIYGRHKVAMSRCGIDIRGRSKKLYVNYRTTEEIRKVAVAMLSSIEVDDLDDGVDDNTRYRSLTHGPEPIVTEATSEEDAGQRAAAFIRDWRTSTAGTHLSACIVASSEKSRDALADVVQRNGMRPVTVTAQHNYSDELDAVHLSTMHRAKGLEFDCVAIVAPRAFRVADEEENGTRRQLLYVALTRARRGAALFLY
ncbi:MAG: AAA family ATPase [Chloroflexi bacterium]|nr:AAA family ATPase [Chloroflexota bacterium]